MTLPACAGIPRSLHSSAGRRLFPARRFPPRHAKLWRWPCRCGPFCSRAPSSWPRAPRASYVRPVTSPTNGRRRHSPASPTPVCRLHAYRSQGFVSAGGATLFVPLQFSRPPTAADPKDASHGHMSLSQWLPETGSATFVPTSIQRLAGHGVVTAAVACCGSPTSTPSVAPAGWSRMERTRVASFPALEQRYTPSRAAERVHRRADDLLSGPSETPFRLRGIVLVMGRAPSAAAAGAKRLAGDKLGCHGCCGSRDSARGTAPATAGTTVDAT